MERRKVPRRSGLLGAALVVAAILFALSVIPRERTGGFGRARQAPPVGTSLSIFVTDELAGYREPGG
jgi:hypothetical protein